MKKIPYLEIKTVTFLYRMIRGAVGKRFVVKHYGGGRIVVTKFPDMSGIVVSGKQRVRRDLFREAVVYGKWIVADEERKKAFRKTLPRKKQKHVYQAAIRLYMRMQGDQQWLRKQLAVKAVVRSGREERVMVHSSVQRGSWRVMWQKREKERAVVAQVRQEESEGGIVELRI
jgi:hypothetical protein